MQMETKQLLPCLLVLLLSNCSLLDVYEDTEQIRKQINFKDKHSIYSLQSKELLQVQPPQTKPVVAVYPTAFTDQTGQRKSNSEFALFSSAITQAPSNLLIRALKHASNGEFFRVVERVGLDNLTKERQIIRSTREELKNENKIMPLLFAGVLLEGAVVSYDSNLITGGAGARYLGIGTSVQYREDTITVSLRMVSVATGEILVEVMSNKTILSYGQSQDVFKFIEMGTELVEVEFGVSRNESTTIALMKAIEGAVLELIIIGYDKGYWKYEENKINEPVCDAECIANIRG
jgi:curli production assembly/transport component CsgG